MASSSTSLEHLVSLYKHVIDDVVKNMKEEYLNEGVDPDLLEELRQIWLGKLNLSGAINRPPKSETTPHPSKTTPTDAHKPHPSNKQQQQQHTPIPKISLPGPPPLVSVSSSANRSSSPPTLIPTSTPSNSSTHSSNSSATALAENTSSVIQHAPPRATPTSTSQASPQLIIHPGMMAQASNSSSTASVAQGILEQLQQASAAGGGGAGANIPTAVTTPSIMPFPLNLVNSTVGQQLASFQQGMVPVQTPQGTVLIPLSTFMTLGMKQNQSSTNPSSTSAPDSQQQSASSTSSSNKEKEVVQLDGLLPLLSGSSSMMSSGMMSSEMTSQSVDNESNSYKCTSECSTDNNSSNYTRDQTVKHWSEDLEQFHSDSKYKSHSNSSNISNRECKRSTRVIVQLDGASGGNADSSSSEDDSDLDDSSEDELGGGTANAGDDEPLCSDDDVSDDEGSKDGGDFETQDTIVCQWEKVYRVKNKWKFQLKDGIMHLGGHDYVFQKVNGEADW